MSQPGASQLHIESYQANLAVGLGRQDFIADRVFPIVTVTTQNDKFPRLLKGAFFRQEAAKRGPGGVYRRSGYNWTYGSYHCEDHGLEHKVPIEDIQNADDPFKPIEDGQDFCENAVLLSREKDISDLVTTAGNWTSSEDVEGGWAKTNTSNTFITDVNAAIKTMLELTGFAPNFLEISYNTFNHLKEVSDILDRIKYTGTQGAPASVTPAMIAALFELDEVLIGKAIYSDAEETLAGTEFNAVRLFETNAGKGGAFLGYRPPNPGRRVPSAGYTLMWPNAVPEEGVDVTMRGYTEMRRYYEKRRRAQIVGATQRYDSLVAAPDAGYCFYDTIST